MKISINQLHHRQLPEWLQSKLARPPAAGAGIHSWLFECAKGLNAWRPTQESYEILKAATNICTRRVPERELVDCLNNAHNDWQPEAVVPRSVILMGQQAPREKAHPEINWDAVSAIAKAGGSIATLRAASPSSVTLSADDVIRELWHGDPLVCIAKAHPADAVTRRRSEWLKEGIAQNGLIVPSPMMAREGKRQDGKPSKRCLDNTGPRWFLVVEFDFKADATPAGSILASMAAEEPSRTAPDLCAAILMHLMGQGAPMVMAVHSGGKSVHGWFPTHGATDDTLRPFFTNACRLGADPATWTLCQLVRLPGGTRADGAHQQILYFNRALINAA